ncbi:MAG: SsrA-binding protein [Chlamydiia bacterium]|nr:SsrA-binding protein [Chlamydiia bacterium]MCH9618119.1 SsrA-binding protein [Chlamydiia bacterium]MCH9623999.1 SsrA-binding protein [Chlamydiia bacterium]
MKKKKNTSLDLVSNRIAYHNYQVIDTMEAGIKLLGTEVKSLRDGGGILQDNYIIIRKGEAFLVQSYIAHYKFGNTNNHEEKRERKLLLHKSEISKLQKKREEKGLTLIALSMYMTKTGFVKVKVGICKGKQLHDKRESLKKKGQEREMNRALKQY